MSYEPLHHKYRPQTFKDLVGQDAIASTLINAINTSRIAPAYLFTGPRGTGKTSSARILAKSLNCLGSDKPTPTPCGKCEVCRAIARSSALDVIEIDAASNTGVDNIREIIERAQFAPVQCRYKVYVIDECHMLSVAAFNALLKTLEEPPSRVIFVLATTDPQRVLPTIISRCQRFDYRRIPLEDMVKHLKYIASKENINIDDEAITLVGQIANGGLRDAESLLDQLSLLSGTVTSDRVWELVGAIPELDLLNLLKAIRSKNPEPIFECCRHLMNRGKEPLIVLQNLAGFYLNLVIAKTAPTRSDLVAVTTSTWTELCQEAQQWKLEEILQGQQHLKDSEAQLKNTTQPRLWLEVTLLGLLSLSVSFQASIEEQPVNEKVNHSLSQNSPQPSFETSVKPTFEVTSPKPEPEPPQPTPEPVQVSLSPAPTIEPSVTTYQNAQHLEDIEQLWHRVLTHLKLPSTQALFSQQGHLVSFNGFVAIVGVNSENLLKLHQSKIPELEAAFQAIFQQVVKVKIQVTNVNESSEITKEKASLNQVYSKPIDSAREIGQLHSTPTQAPQPTINNNGKHPQPKPLSTPEPDSPPQSFQSNGAIKESLETSTEIKPDYSDNEVKKAVDIFIKEFEGELIIQDKGIESNELETKQPVLNNNVTPTTETTNLTDNYQEKEVEQQQSEPKTTPQIKGRMDISDISEDELEF